MKVYEGLANAFAAEGVTDVFGIMGDGNMYWMQALDDRGVRLLEVRHEGAGLGMADGWARYSSSSSARLVASSGRLSASRKRTTRGKRSA